MFSLANAYRFDNVIAGLAAGMKIAAFQRKTKARSEERLSASKIELCFPV